MCHFAVAVQKIVRCCKQVLGKQLNSKAVRGEGAREVTHLAQRYELMPGKSFSHRNSQRSLRLKICGGCAVIKEGNYLGSSLPN